MKGFAIHNAPTDHGGLIPSTQVRSSQQGNLFVRAGDGHFCPKCKCWSTVIKSHDLIIFDGKAVAYAGDKLTCGATIQPQQSHVVGDSGGVNYTGVDNLKVEILSYSDKYQLLDESTSEPLINQHYKIYRESGDIIEGKTDNNGYTQNILNDNNAEVVTIEVVGGDVDLKDLL
ncbi:PAAR domain-containing protein [Acinetobacter larvae]|uniref:PAAR domain-containing protein n=1 Tax=Acinetobacter larvae TaxID=1789224 RepID=A0A1B2LZE6_9GAMM|nr:PAAR domain-containing protein [Acinetobacter larvae]AOA58291.1 hypothetical protein BFG52_07915 [Acinetobacter larvae]